MDPIPLFSRSLILNPQPEYRKWAIIDYLKMLQFEILCWSGLASIWCVIITMNISSFWHFRVFIIVCNQGIQGCDTRGGVKPTPECITFGVPSNMIFHLVSEKLSFCL